MVKMGRVAPDGAKPQANAFKRKAMSHGRLIDEEERVEAEAADKACHVQDEERRRRQCTGTYRRAGHDRLNGPEASQTTRHRHAGPDKRPATGDHIRAASCPLLAHAPG